MLTLHSTLMYLIAKNWDLLSPSDRTFLLQGWGPGLLYQSFSSLIF